MKMTRKLIPALVMLLVSAIMLSTASFAWFASNDKVTATGMSVNAKAAEQFLQIYSETSGEFGITAAGKAATKDVKLVNAKINGIGTSNIAWGVGSSTTVDNANAGQTLTPVVVSDDYALINTFSLKLSDGSTGSLENITVRQITVTTNGNTIADAFRVLVVGPSGSLLFDYDVAQSKMILVSDSAATLGDAVLIDVLEANEDANEITVYAYYDGEDSVANTAAATTLEAMSFEILFATKTAVIPNS